MNQNLLTDDDLNNLTGASQAKKQCAVLDESGIFYVRRTDGKPRTTWYNVNHPAHLRTPQMQDEPDFGWMEQH